MSALAHEIAPGRSVPVSMRFLPAAEHVRTVRLVVVAVARRAGFDEDRLEDVRLAVGEVCARAVRRSLSAGIREPVVVHIDDTASAGPSLRVVVSDHAGAQSEDPVALALLHGLADGVTVSTGPGGAAGLVTLDWSSLL